MKSVTQSKASGKFKAYVPPGKYQINFLLNGFVWDKYANSLGMEEISLEEEKHYEVTLKSIHELYPDQQ